MVISHMIKERSTHRLVETRKIVKAWQLPIKENVRHTHFSVLDRFGDFTLLNSILELGRTHQIRVHMKYIGYPLAGDPKYGPKKTINFNGQALHAGALDSNIREQVNI